MVVALGPGRFYGSSLPRPRFYADVKLNDVRVDPPAPVMDPLLSWANEAHWSMGGLSFKRHRLQGRIEGSVKRLRAQQEKTQRRTTTMVAKARVAGQKPLNLAPLDSGSSDGDEKEGAAEDGRGSEASFASPPNGSAGRKRRRVRRLGEEFDRIAAEQMKKSREEVSGVASRTRRRRLIVEEIELDEEDALATASPAAVNKKGSAEGKKEVGGGLPRRTSPRKQVDGGLLRTSPRKKQSS